MAIGYSFAASHRWLPRYDFGDVAGTEFSIPELEIYTDPLFHVEAEATVFQVPTLNMVNLLRPLGSIASETEATVFQVPTLNMVNLLRPLGSIASETEATVFSAPTVSMLDVLLPMGSLASETEASVFRIPTVSCAPP